MQGYICLLIKLALSHLSSKILIRSNEFGKIATISDGTIQNVRTLACNNLSFLPTHKQKVTHRLSRWFFIFGHSPCLLAERTALL